jgi:hypothetical protein
VGCADQDRLNVLAVIEDLGQTQQYSQTVNCDVDLSNQALYLAGRSQHVPFLLWPLREMRRPAPP